MIRVFLASVICLFALAVPAFADTRQVYTISNVPVDESAPSVIEARQKAMATARVVAARRLIKKLTLAEDRATATGLQIDSEIANRLAAAVDVQEETAGAGRYRGTLAVVLNPRMVRAFLDDAKVPYVDTQGPLGLMVPIASNLAIEDEWRIALGERNDSSLSPYVTANGLAYTADTDWSVLSVEASSQRARRGVLAELKGRDGAWRVALSTVTAAGTEAVGTTSPQPTLEAAADAAATYMGEAWKRASIVRSGTRTRRQANVRYTSLAEWNTLRGALVRSPLVSEFQINAIARDGAMITFSYAGEPPRLQNDLLQRGVALNEQAGAWVLTSAVSAN